MNGKIGGILFALQEREHRDYLKKRAIQEINNEEIFEWYRQQYNIPLHEFRNLDVEYDDIVVDFYRRQYWNEIRLGVRKWDDVSIEMKMPPFTLYRPSGGALPVPNGYNYENDYTVKLESYTSNSSSADITSNKLLKSSVVTPKEGTFDMSPNQESEYKLSEDEFASMMKSAETDTSVWDELESFDSLSQV